MVNIEYFKLPIEYIDNKKINKTIIDDLQLIPRDNDKLKNSEYKNIDISNNSDNHNSLYEIIFKPSHLFSKESIKLWSKSYTTDIDFLKQHKHLIQNYTHFDSPSLSMTDSNTYSEIYDIYSKVSIDNNFLEKYQYIDLSYFKHLNTNDHILQVISIINLTSPVIALILPIILLLLPFFVLKITKAPINLQTYLTLLKQLFSSHPIGRLFSDYKSVPIDKQMYLIFSVLFYFYQMFLNAKSCYKFYTHISTMSEYLSKTEQYIDYTLQTFEHFEKQTCDKNKFKLFINDMNAHKDILKDYKNELNQITDLSNIKFNVSKIGNIGKLMKNFYTLHNNEYVKKSMIYSFGFHGYMDNIKSLNKQCNEKLINECIFKEKGSCKFKDAYYPVLDNPIKNSYKLNKNILITGPNAAGKTTILKTTLFNILFSQQTGLGFYKKAIMTPYSYLHSYLNIPDTLGRDSLFQAEARRCKEIIDELRSSDPKEKHFCIFDELYSGTNPYEAISSSVSLLKYISKFNMNYILTTHYLDVCKKLDKHSSFGNYHMDIKERNEDFVYTYKLIKGMSHIKGGIKVLNDLNYPEEIINETKLLIGEVNV